MDRKKIIKQAMSGSRIGNKTAHIPVFWEGGKVSVGIGVTYQQFENEQAFFNAIPDLLEKVDGVFYKGKMIENLQDYRRLRKALKVAETESFLDLEKY
ncbi:hypothetical protein [Epilithonimonas hominis]|uniref:hypothetical protein n=1 Tax=Epilithonimonas hominis TaxID=420404 RepID=UPI00289656E0|nr:hypothetical protein [Epilithonimonas hominis]